MENNTITASEFKAKCLKLMDDVVNYDAPLVITKNGKPVAQLSAIKPAPGPIFGAMKQWAVMPQNTQENLLSAYTPQECEEIQKEMEAEWDEFFPVLPGNKR